VAAVTFGANRAAPVRIGLVLGSGGVLGAAWMTGALVRLGERLPCPATDADLIVGTSAGSVIAAALRCGASTEEMVAWQYGEADGSLAGPAALAAQEGPFPPLPHLRPGSLPLARAALLRPLRVPPWVGASAFLPSGRGQHTALRALVTALHPDPGWVTRRTWIAAMDYNTGERVLFGADGAPTAPLPDAVVASCSIPGWYAPAVIGGRRYVDGGVRSATSLGALRGTDVQQVWVLAPMASTEPDHPFQPHLRLERRVRQLLTRVLVRQAQALAAEGKQVIVVTPGPRELAVMGANLMDPRRRRDVLEVSLGTPPLAAAA
jgi:NTE family protein